MSEEFKTTLAAWRPGVPAPVWIAVICCGVFVVAPVFGAIGIAALTAGVVGSKIVDERPKVVDDRPSLRLNIEQLARLPVRSQLLAGSRFGRAELHEYGSIYNRDVNFSLVMGIPPSDAVLTNGSMPHFSDVRLMRNARTVSSSIHYDLETRLGPMRATEVRVDNDGQWKQCLTFVSRFDSLALYMMGAYCDASGTKPSPDRLACMLSRVELHAPVPSPEAEGYLRERLEHAYSCSAHPVSQTIDTGQRRPSPPSRWSTPSAQRR
jgi:hypothetical protein